MLGEELGLPGPDAVVESSGGGHRSILSGSTQLHVRVVLERLADRPLDLAQRPRVGAPAPRPAAAPAPRP